jgi:hypothetical protein
VREREDANRTREAGHLDEIQGVVANTLSAFRNGAVGFIDWLGRKTWKNRRCSRQRTCETVRLMRLALLKTGSVAGAVLTPWNKDLESSTRTKTAPLTKRRYRPRSRSGSTKCAQSGGAFCGLTRHKISDRARESAWLRVDNRSYEKREHGPGRCSLHHLVRPWETPHLILASY